MLISATVVAFYKVVHSVVADGDDGINSPKAIPRHDVMVGMVAALCRIERMAKVEAATGGEPPEKAVPARTEPDGWCGQWTGGSEHIAGNHVARRGLMADGASLAAIAVEEDAAVIQAVKDVAGDRVVGRSVDGNHFPPRAGHIECIVANGVSSAFGIEIDGGGAERPYEYGRDD